MARRILREMEPDDAVASRDSKESNRAALPSTINSSIACSQSENQRHLQAAIPPRQDSFLPTHRTSRFIPSGLHREQTSGPVSSYATEQTMPDSEPRRKLRPEPNPQISKPSEQHQGSRFKAREAHKKGQSSPDRPGLSKYHRRQLSTREQLTDIGSSCRWPSGPYSGSLHHLGRDYNAVSCEPNGYERFPHQGHSKPRHRSIRSRDRKFKEPAKRLRDIFTHDTSRRHAPAVEEKSEQPELADRKGRLSRYGWAKDACRVADRSIAQDMRGEMRSRSRHWEMFDNDQRRWIVPNGDCPRYVKGRHASGARHQAESMKINGRQESRRHNHGEARQFSA